MSVVLVANGKGGVGKTTVAVNIAAMCALAGKSTILVDTDDEMHSSAWAASRHETEQVLTLTCVAKRGKVGFDIAKLKEKYDVVVVDAGGHDSTEMRQSIAVCDLLLIPMRPSQFDLWSVSRMESVVKELSEKMERRINAFSFINAASPNPSVREIQETRDSLQEYKDVFPLMDSVLCDRIAFRRSARAGLGVVELSRDQADPKASIEMINFYQEAFNEEWTTA